MSNYPPANLPPQGPFGFDYNTPQPGQDLLRPARRASLMLWIIGGLGATCGLCVATSIWFIPSDQIMERLRATITPEQQREIQSFDLLTFFRIVMTVLCVIGLVISGTMIGTAGPVRRGSRTAAIIALITCGLILLFCGLRALVDLIGLARGVEVVSSVGDLIFCAIIAAAMGVTIKWLFQTLNASGQIARQNQMQAQYWLYQQQQQSAGYGYGVQTAVQPAVSTQGWLNLPPPPPPPANGISPSPVEGSENPPPHSTNE